MSDLNLNLKLDEEFLYILEFSKTVLSNFSNDQIQNSLCDQWLSKLCSDSYEKMNAKRTRNSYLTKLIVCMFNGQLSEMFLEKPPEGDLNAIEMPFIIETEPYWLKDAIGSNENGNLNDGGKDCRTYMSTKMLDDNRGVCAYIAMNVTDEGDDDNGNNWLNFDDERKFDGKIEDIFEKDERLNLENLIRNQSMKKMTEENVFFEHRKFLIKLIMNELEGKADEGENPDLEEFVGHYLREIQGTEEEQVYTDLPSYKKRNFLLSNGKSVLINDLIKLVK